MVWRCPSIGCYAIPHDNDFYVVYYQDVIDAGSLIIEQY